MKIYRIKNQFLHADTTVSTNGEILRIQWEKLNNTQSLSEVGDVFLDFAALKQSPSFSDHTLWVLGEKNKVWLPLFAITSITKETLAEYTKLNGNVIACLFVRLANDSLADCSLSIVISEDSTLDTGGETVTPAESNASIYAKAFPNLEIGEPVVEGDIFTFPLTLLNADGQPLVANATAYCEVTSGVLLTNRVEIVNGTGNIKVNVSGLGGTSTKVKAGFKFYSGIDEKHFTA
jgi:hypothetical protein